MTFVASSTNIWMCVYFDIRQTGWNLRALALDSVYDRVTTQVWWKNTSLIIVGMDADQKYAFRAYDRASSVFTRVSVSCERGDPLMQVSDLLSLGAVKYLPGIGVPCKHSADGKVVLLSEERVPHCKSLSRMAWLQACAM
jgi:hypothetical protein